MKTMNRNYGGSWLEDIGECPYCGGTLKGDFTGVIGLHDYEFWIGCNRCGYSKVEETKEIIREGKPNKIEKEKHTNKPTKEELLEIAEGIKAKAEALEE